MHAKADRIALSSRRIMCPRARAFRTDAGRATDDPMLDRADVQGVIDIRTGRIELLKSTHHHLDEKLPALTNVHAIANVAEGERHVAKVQIDERRRASIACTTEWLRLNQVASLEPVFFMRGQVHCIKPAMIPAQPRERASPCKTVHARTRKNEGVRGAMERWSVPTGVLG